MTANELLMVQLAEECTEVAQRVMKNLRFGPHDVQIGQGLDNLERLAAEVDDLETVLAMLRSRGILRRPDIAAMDLKTRKIMRYAKLSVERGILDIEEYKKLFREIPST